MTRRRAALTQHRVDRDRNRAGAGWEIHFRRRSVVGLGLRRGSLQQRLQAGGRSGRPSEEAKRGNERQRAFHRELDAEIWREALTPAWGGGREEGFCRRAADEKKSRSFERESRPVSENV